MNTTLVFALLHVSENDLHTLIPQMDYAWTILFVFTSCSKLFAGRWWRLFYSQNQVMSFKVWQNVEYSESLDKTSTDNNKKCLNCIKNVNSPGCFEENSTSIHTYK